MNDYTIRLEKKKDYREVENLVRELIPGYLDGIIGVYQTPKGYEASGEE